jgi:hypothetical protein
MKSWIYQRDGESVADYALRVTNDGRMIAILFVVGWLAIIGGFVLTGCQ